MRAKKYIIIHKKLETQMCNIDFKTREEADEYFKMQVSFWKKTFGTDLRKNWEVVEL